MPGIRTNTKDLGSSFEKLKQMEMKNPYTAFENAIASGRLSKDRNAANYVGLYMYMGTQDGKDLFKHYDTRNYLP